MLLLYVQLRYHRQLSIISPAVVTSFFDVLSDSASRNGGTEQSLPGGAVYRFSADSVGYVFAAPRMLSDVAEELKRQSHRIREYLVLIDSVSSAESGDPLQDYGVRYKNVPFPDTGILIGPDAVTLLSPYTLHKPVPQTPFVRWEGNRIAPVSDPDRGGLGTSGSLTIYGSGAVDELSSVLDMLELAGIEPPEGTESTAVRLYKSFRYEEPKGEYIAETVTAWARSALGSLPAQRLPLRIGTEANTGGIFQWVSSRFPALSLEPLSGELPPPRANLDSVPPDMLDMAYLLFRSSAYLYAKELPLFFASLGRNEDFLSALGHWLASVELLSDPRDLRSLNYSVWDRLRDRLGSRCVALDLLLADFIWNAYVKGELQPTFSLLGALQELGFKIPDEFLVACLYHGGNPAEEIQRMAPLFAAAGLYEAVLALERARKAFSDGAEADALALARDVLHRFQKAGVPAGEYHALRLISELSRNRGKGGEAVSYLEYALENAERIHDNAFTLDTRYTLAVLQYVNGDLSTARSSLGTLERLCAANLDRETEIAVALLAGRISFDLGDYPQAASHFQRVGSLAAGIGLQEAVMLGKAWYARAVAHQHRYLQALELLSPCAESVAEGWAFLLEASILSGKPLSGRDIPDVSHVLSVRPCESSRYDWSSAFSIMEDARRGGAAPGGCVVRMHEALYRYYRSFFLGADGADEAVFIGELARRASENGDVFSQVYFYLAFLLGSSRESTGKTELLSTLSRAFKQLQNRAAFISDVTLREAFLQNPTWNNRLYRSARENKLI